MNTVIIHFDEEAKVFENVTKVKVCCTGDIFNSHIRIYQAGTKATNKIAMIHINGIEIK